MIKQVAKKVLESNGTKSVSSAMKEAGYSESTCSNPQQVTRSKTYKEIFGETVTKEDLTRIHRQHLYSENEMVSLKGLDMAYKVNGDYAPEKSVSLTANLDIESDNPKMKEFKKQTIEKLRELYES